MEQLPREVCRDLPETVLFICRDDRGQVVVADEADPGTAVSLARGWAEMGFRVQIKFPLSVQQRRALLAANPPTTIHPSQYRPNPALLKPGLPGTWMAPFGSRVASEYEKVTARNAFHYAVHHGKVERPASCQKCGAEEGAEEGPASLDAHHEDYANPLDVVYLCRSCHRRRHALRNQAVPIDEWLRQPEEGSGAVVMDHEQPSEPPSRASARVRLGSGMFLTGQLLSAERQRHRHFELRVRVNGPKRAPRLDRIVMYPTLPGGEPSEFAPAVAWITAAVGERVIVEIRGSEPKIVSGNKFIWTGERVWRLADVIPPWEAYAGESGR